MSNCVVDRGGPISGPPSLISRPLNTGKDTLRVRQARSSFGTSPSEIAAPRRGRVTALLTGPLPWAEGFPRPISLQKAKGAGLPYGPTKGPQAPYAYERQSAPYRGLSLHLVATPPETPKGPPASISAALRVMRI